MAAATNRMPDKCPRFTRLFVMVHHAGKVFLLAKYRDHDGCAVRKREASVSICRVSDYVSLRGYSSCTGTVDVAKPNNPVVRSR